MLNGALTMLCDLHAPAAGKTALGHARAGHPVETADVPCLLQPSTTPAREFRRGNRIHISTHMLFLDSGATLTHQHQVKNVRRSDGSVLHAGPFDVLDVNDPTGEQTHLEADLELVR